MRRLNYISTIVILLISVNLFSQNYIGKAYNFYKEKRFDSAKVYIDSAVFYSDEGKYSQTWQLRGIIYRNLDTNKNIALRKEAMDSFVKAMVLDSINEFNDRIVDYMVSLNIRYYNDAVEYLQVDSLEKAEESYNTYKKNYELYIKINQDFTESDKQFYDALGAAWFNKTKLVEAGQKKEFYEKAISKFNIVLQLDSMDYQANYGIGICYYNQGVDLAISMDPFSTDIEEINRIQEESTPLFLKAKPYLMRAYKVNPNEKEVIEGLTGTYNALSEIEEYEYFQQLLNKLNE
jgi:tetratricopeptide (TPR) repeat protein